MEVVGLMGLGVIMRGWRIVGSGRKDFKWLLSLGMVGHEREVVRRVCLHGGSPGTISGGRNGYVDGGWVESGNQVVRRTLGDGEPHVTSGFHSAHLVFALFDVALGLVIHV